MKIRVRWLDRRGVGHENERPGSEVSIRTDREMGENLRMVMQTFNRCWASKDSEPYVCTRTLNICFW